MWKVVAADDEGYIREALKKLINWEKMDCDLIAVLEDGQELIECIEKESPDIVITDIQMPEVNGLDVCKYLYETRPETQVIILTAFKSSREFAIPTFNHMSASDASRYASSKSMGIEAFPVFFW